MTEFSNLTELAATAPGTHLGHSSWHPVEQKRIDAFADATGDHQWIHVDLERAKQSPFGTTIAHGYLTLSLIPILMREVFHVAGVRMAVNYGLNKVRFPAPVPSGARIRAGAEIVGVDELPGGVQVVTRVTIEIEGGDKPGCVADTVVRYYG